jgi:hypothetical protein
MRLPWLRGALLGALLVGGGACATLPPEHPPRADDHDVIREPELESFERLNTLQLVQRLRPYWLRARGQASDDTRHGVRVYLDGIDDGGVGNLRRVPVAMVGEIRFLDAREATLRYGTGHPGGAIVVSTRHGRPPPG